MKLILAIRPPHSDALTHHTITRFPATIGRGYDSDVILPDPHVDETHCRISHDGENFILTNLCPVNPAHVNEKTATQHILSSGDVITAGMTTLHAYAPDHPVAPVRPLLKAGRLFTWAASGIVAWVCFFTALAAATGWSYLGTWDRDITPQLTSTAAGAIFILLIWSGIWALAGKLSKNQPAFMTHICFSSVYLICSIIALELGRYIDFMFQGGTFSTVAGYGLDGVLLGFLIYASLTTATHIAPRKRAISTALFTLGLIIGIFAVEGLSQQQFRTHASHPAQLVPYMTELAPVTPLETFAQENKTLFRQDSLITYENQ